MMGWCSYFILLFVLSPYGVNKNVSLISGVLIGTIGFIIAWLKRDEPMDKIMEHFFGSGTGNDD